MTWRPIETAPKDGSEVLFTDGRGYYLGKWAGRRLRWAVATHVKEFGAFTHWMPLPDPPGAECVEVRQFTPEEIADVYQNPNPGEPTAREHLEAFKRARDKWDDPIWKATAECHALVFMEDHAERLLRATEKMRESAIREVKWAMERYQQHYFAEMERLFLEGDPLPIGADPPRGLRQAVADGAVPKGPDQPDES